MRRRARAVVNLTMREAEYLGIARCKHCKFPRNNHFDWKPYACAHTDDCPGFKLEFVMGKAIKRKAKTVALGLLLLALPAPLSADDGWRTLAMQASSDLRRVQKRLDTVHDAVVEKLVPLRGLRAYSIQQHLEVAAAELREAQGELTDTP